MKWSGVTVKYLGTKIPCILGCVLLRVLDCVVTCFIWCVSCTVNVVTCFVMGGCVCMFGCFGKRVFTVS